MRAFWQRFLAFNTTGNPVDCYALDLHGRMRHQTIGTGESKHSPIAFIPRPRLRHHGGQATPIAREKTGEDF
ncbi:MAG: hypothetical protein CBB71_10800 [Rhodopirellula sp. TMED11]|nr:MAG: hypothetical protein CBB71_10800 [Rhodopirellula sp. TMED11]